VTSSARPLLLLVPEASPPWYVLEHFVANRLHESGVWSSPRTSDGVSSARVVEDGPDRARIGGRIWTIEQTLHSFWIDAERDRASADRFGWTLYFDLDPAALTARQLRDAVDVLEDPRQARWRTVLSGHAVDRNGRLAPEHAAGIAK
jgi:hypothetical protein